MKALSSVLIASVTAVGLLSGVPTPEAQAITESCRLHLERVEKATGKHVSAAEDRRYWLSKGQPARYCSEDDEREQRSPSQKQQRQESPDRHRDKIGRHCAFLVFKCG